MGSNPHRGTLGHSIAKSIFAKDKPPAGPGDSTTQLDPELGQTAEGFHNINVKNAQNGIIVSHTPPMPKNVQPYSEKAPQEQEHVFRSAVQAHHHIGQLLGVRMASGDQKV